MTQINRGRSNDPLEKLQNTDTSAVPDANNITTSELVKILSAKANGSGWIVDNPKAPGTKVIISDKDGATGNIF